MSWIEDQIKDFGRAIDKYFFQPIKDATERVIDLVLSPFMPDMPEIGDALAGRSSTSPNSVASGKIIYGRTRVSGTTIYYETGGDEDRYLWSAACFACHEVEKFQKIYYHDILVAAHGNAAGDPYNNFWYYPPFTDAGENGGVANYKTVIYHYKNGGEIDLPSGSGQNLSFDSVNRYAYNNAVLTFRHFKNDEGTNFPHGVPNVTAEIKGAKVYDPRKDSTSSIYDSSLGVSDHRTDDEDTWEWSDNPVLCLLDYMTNTLYGLGESHNNFDYPAILESINTCNEDITINDDGDTQKAFTCNGVLSTERDFKGNIAILLGSMNGRLTFSGGKFFIDAYHYKTPHTDTITEDDCLGSIQVTTKASRKNMYNTVRGKFTDKDANYILSEYPIQTSSTYISDDGEELQKEANLAMTDDNIRAQRIAHFLLLRSRMQDAIKFDMGLGGLKYRVGDNIKISNTIMGYQAKIFEITQLAVKPNPKTGIMISIEAIENVEANYDPDSVTYKDYTTDGLVNIPDYNNVATPTNLQLVRKYIYVEDDDNTLTPKAAIVMSFDHLNLEYISRFEIRYSKLTNLGQWISSHVPVTEEIEHEIRNLDINTTYKIMAYAVSVNNVFSPMVTINVTTPAEHVVAPPTNLAVNTFILDERPKADISWTASTSDNVTYEVEVMQTQYINNPNAKPMYANTSETGVRIETFQEQYRVRVTAIIGTSRSTYAEATFTGASLNVVAPSNISAYRYSSRIHENGLMVQWTGALQSDGVNPYELQFKDYVIDVTFPSGIQPAQYIRTTNIVFIAIPDIVNDLPDSTTTITVRTRNTSNNYSDPVTYTIGSPQKIVPAQKPRQVIEVYGTQASPTEAYLTQLVQEAGERVLNETTVRYVELDGSNNAINAKEFEFQTEQFSAVFTSDALLQEVDSDTNNLPEFVNDGGFDDPSAWTNYATSQFSVTGSKLVCTATAGTSIIWQDVRTNIVGDHTVKFDVDAVSQTGSFVVSIYENLVQIASYSITGTGTKTFDFTSQNRNIMLVIQRAGQESITMDNMSIKPKLRDSITEYTLYLPETVTQTVTFAHNETDKVGVPATGVTETYTGFSGTNLTDKGRKYVKVSLARSATATGNSSLSTKVTATWTEAVSGIGDTEKQAELDLLLNARVF